MNDLIRSRSLIWAMVKRDLRGRYAGSTLGFCWAVFQPVIFIAVFAVAFSSAVMQDRYGTFDEDLARIPIWLRYIVFLCPCILAWNAFQESTNRTANVFVENGTLIKKVAFSEFILPVVVIISSVFRFLIDISVFLVLLFFLGHFPGRLILFLPVILLMQAAFTFGLGLTLATLNVFFRDVGHVTTVALFVLFWATPIVLREELYPDWFRSYVLPVHPIHKLISMYRDVFVMHRAPNMAVLVVFCLMALGTLVTGIGVYRSLRREIPDFV